MNPAPAGRPNPFFLSHPAVLPREGEAGLEELEGWELVGGRVVVSQTTAGGETWLVAYPHAAPSAQLSDNNFSFPFMPILENEAIGSMCQYWENSK